MSRRIVVAAMCLTFAAGCSRPPERTSAASPTAPSAVTLAATGQSAPTVGGGVSGPMAVGFPPRNEVLDFRNQLETLYATVLNRAASATTVDREGEVVWTQEYIRYRVNGCDHQVATQRVFDQIAGNPPGAICSENPGGDVQYPPRNEANAFRQGLETVYEQMGRPLSSSAVDPEGGVIWTQEYLRYRNNACDHPTSVQKVFSQIAGNGVSATCYVPPCSYWIRRDYLEVGVAAGKNTVDLNANTAGCTWTATSDSSWLTLSAPTSGTEAATVSFSYTANQGAFRTGTIRFEWPGGSARYRVEQAASPTTLTVQLFDPFRSSNATTNCQIRSSGAANTCNLVASTNLPGAVTSYVWSASYVYGTTTKTVTQSSASNTLAITDQCGRTGSSAEGTAADLTVSVTATDSQGNTQSLSIGAGVLRMTFYTCGV